MSEPATMAPTLRGQVAEEVRALLGRRRMSDIALARKMGKSHTYVWRRLKGETAFDVDDLERIADVLEVDVADLLGVAADARLRRRGSNKDVLQRRHERPARPQSRPNVGRPPNRPAYEVLPPGRRRPAMVRP